MAGSGYTARASIRIHQARISALLVEHRRAYRNFFCAAARVRDF